MQEEIAHPLALVLAHFRKGENLFPTLTLLRVHTLSNVVRGDVPVSEIDRLPHGDGKTVRNVCAHFGLKLPA
ncbi:MAG: hypothetical protein RLZZ342_224 [Candidatus Parcubacteria bacterium]|jgi:hypothetical protein